MRKNCNSSLMISFSALKAFFLQFIHRFCLQSETATCVNGPFGVPRSASCLSFLSWAKFTRPRLIAFSIWLRTEKKRNLKKDASSWKEFSALKIVFGKLLYSQKTSCDNNEICITDSDKEIVCKIKNCVSHMDITLFLLKIEYQLWHLNVYISIIPPVVQSKEILSSFICEPRKKAPWKKLSLSLQVFRILCCFFSSINANI